MIHTSTQLKALIRNESHGDNAKAMTLIRNYEMERFLERLSLSKYRDRLILKGGLLIASMVGLDNRATMDIDTTIRNYNLSTDDVITPKEVNYEYTLMFEERTIPLLAYNLETVLAEKMETIISRGILNTRMRDYYDLMILKVVKSDAINYEDLAKAFKATSKKRESYELASDLKHILKQIKFDAGLAEQWEIYQRKYDYAIDYNWEDIVENIEQLFEKMM